LSHSQPSDRRPISTDVLIIGFGLSAIPLIRELERDNVSYAVVSNGHGSIWDRLERHDRLDFDLVSSVHSSMYSFELVNRETKDRYPTAKEFSAFIRKYLTQYGSKVVKF
jgi:cation diffusion facilitator CzcD-associated flavoprotein CzcO